MILTDETHAVMEPRDLRELLEYSTSIPTSPRAGFRWKRRIFDRAVGWTDRWFMGEAGEPDDEGIPIAWREILLEGDTETAQGEQ